MKKYLHTTGDIACCQTMRDILVEYYDNAKVQGTPSGDREFKLYVDVKMDMLGFIDWKWCPWCGTKLE